MVPNMKAKYTAEVAPALMKKFQYESAMQIPKLDKIVINVGCGKEANGNSKVIEAIVRDITLISGQKPIITHAKKSIANFKLRDGMPVGVKVTLRRDRMWEFLDRLFNVALPRVRDFRGINGNAFDGRGNYALGLSEQLIFPEISYDQIDKIRGMNIVICTTANTDEEAKELLTLMGAPAVRTLTCVISVSAVSASASWLTRARSRVSARHPGKEERFQKGTRKGSFFYVFRQKVSGAHELRSNTLLLGGVYTLSMMFKN